MRTISLIAIIWAAPCLVSAHIINVPAEYATIQGGIDASVNGDTVLVAPATYHERINFNGHACILGSLFLANGDTSSIGETIIDGDAAGSVVTFNHSEDSIAALVGFTIRNGHAVNGSGINCINAGPTIRNNIITSNMSTSDAGMGGGICCENNSGAIIAFNWIIGNRGGYGAGIAAYNSSPVIERNFIFGNAATWGEVGGNGGGIYCSGPSTPIIVGNEIRFDSAYWGGGGIACFSSAQAMIAGNTISDNAGGGVQLGAGNSILTNNIIIGNSGEFVGGGIRCFDFSGDIRNNIIAGNSSPSGGGIYYYSQQFAPSIGNNVIYGNSSGIFFHGSGLAIVNSIIWGNDTYEIQLDAGSTASITYCDALGGWPGIGNIDVEPGFRDLTNSDYRLLWIPCGAFYDSPCIDAGNPDSLDGELHCLAGLGTSRSDMGAYGGGGNVTGVDGEREIIPTMPQLLYNYPNPFNAQTTISFSTPEAGLVEIDIFDILGRRIGTAFSGDLQAGQNRIIWDAGSLPSGAYFYRLAVGDKFETGKMILLK